MRWNCLAGILTLGVCLGLLSAHSQEPAASNEQIAQLIRQLGADTFAEREKAQKALEAIGEAALPALKEAAEKSQDIEIKRRASDLVRVIEAQIAARRLRSPTLISVAYHQTPVSAVLDDLAAKTGLSFQWDVPPSRQVEIRNKLITLRLDQKPLWEVVDKTLAACGLQQGFPRPGEIADQAVLQEFVLEAGPRRPVPVAYCGVARIRLLELGWVKEKPGVKSSDLQMLMEICVEPDRFAFQHQPTLREIRALDKDGHLLPVKLAPAVGAAPSVEDPAVAALQFKNNGQVQVAAIRIAAPGRKLEKRWRSLVTIRLNNADEQPAQLQGSFLAEVVMKETITISDPLTAERRTYGQADGLQLRLVEASRQDNQVKVVLELMRPLAQAGRLPPMPVAQNPVAAPAVAISHLNAIELYDDQADHVRSPPTESPVMFAITCLLILILWCSGCATHRPNPIAFCSRIPDQRYWNFRLNSIWFRIAGSNLPAVKQSREEGHDWPKEHASKDLVPCGSVRCGVPNASSANGAERWPGC
jgi:hypothetical protein